MQIETKIKWARVGTALLCWTFFATSCIDYPVQKKETDTSGTEETPWATTSPDLTVCSYEAFRGSESSPIYSVCAGIGDPTAIWRAEFRVPCDTGLGDLFQPMVDTPVTIPANVVVLADGTTVLDADYVPICDPGEGSGLWYLDITLSYPATDCDMYHPMFNWVEGVPGGVMDLVLPSPACPGWYNTTP